MADNTIKSPAAVSASSSSAGRPKRSSSIHQGADLLVQIIEQEKARAVEEARKEYAELDRRYADFRNASDTTLKTALDRAQAWSRAMQRTQDEANKFKEMYQRLQDIVRQSPAAQELLHDTGSDVTKSPDLTVLLPQILHRLQASETELQASRRKCTELRRERDSDIARLNAKIAELQDDIDAIRAGSDEMTATEDTPEPSDIKMKLNMSQHASSSSETPLPQATDPPQQHAASPLNLKLLNYGRPSLDQSVPPRVSLSEPSSSQQLKSEQLSPLADKANLMSVKSEPPASTPSSTIPVRPRLSLSELRALVAKKGSSGIVPFASPIAGTFLTAPNGSQTFPPGLIVNGASVPEGIDVRRYCVCEELAYGEMIACDAPGCRREWFHLACVGLTVAPDGSWQCFECSSNNPKLLAIA